LYRITLSLKYLLSRRLNIICVLGVALGVMLLILVLSVMDGFQDQLKRTIRGSLSDITLSPRFELDYERFEEELRARVPEVVALSPQLRDFAVVTPARETRIDSKVGAQVIGIDADREMAVSEFRDYLRDRRLDVFTVADPDRPFWVQNEDLRDRGYPGIVLGREVGDRLGVGRGWIVYLLTAMQVTDAETRESRLEPREMRFVVTGFYESGNAEYDGAVVYVDRQAARDFTGGRSDLAEVRVRLKDHRDADAVRQKILDQELELFRACAADREQVQDVEEALKIHRQIAARAGKPFDLRDRFREHSFFVVRTWKDQRRVFLAAIENEKRIMAVIVGFIVLVAAFMIIALLSMLVVHKTRDIGIIKALGGTTRGILSIFMWNGLIMGVVGAFLGLGLGLLLTWKINEAERGISRFLSWILGHEVGLFPKDIYLFSEIPTRTDPSACVFIMIFAIVSAWLASLYPARRAARMDPVEALRYE
jgi:lipoprotein-releasing system permease protein